MSDKGAGKFQIRLTVPRQMGGEPLVVELPPDQLQIIGQSIGERIGKHMEEQGLVMVSKAELDALVQRLEDAEDALRVREGEARGGPSPDALPAEAVRRLTTGEHPLRIWREHRRLTLAALAERADVPASYISEIETGKKPGSVKALKALADALDVDLDDLVAEDLEPTPPPATTHNLARKIERRIE